MNTKSETRNPEAQPIRIENDELHVPMFPIIPFIEGDGSGPDIWRAARRVIDAAVQKAYGSERSLQWMEIIAGEKAFRLTGNWLPEDTLQAFRDHLIGIKGPLATPVGGGMRSLNVALRKALDLYVCQRPIRWFSGVPSPVRHPEKVNMIVFRENTEDVYTGIEFEYGSQENEKLSRLLKENFPKAYAQIRFPDTAAFGLKPISKEGSQRLVRAAIRWALQNRRSRVTLVHKGNIMKFTEGAFRAWGYEVAENEFCDQVYTDRQWQRTLDKDGRQAADDELKLALASGKLWINDVIADAVFERTITRPEDFDVLAAPNLNGDYLSDALAAQVGGIGIAPGANINYVTGAAIFEATHGTAPMLANQDKANPCSVILSAEMMLRYIGWGEAANLLIRGVEEAIAAKRVTFDFYHMMEGAVLLKTSEFGDEVINRIKGS